MKRTVWLAGVVVVLTATITWGQASDKSDKAKLKGVWEVTSLEFGGMKIELPGGKKIVITIDGDKISMDDGQKKKEGTLKLDQTKKPRQFEILEGTVSKMKGIYQLDGDTLKWGMGGPGADAPIPSGFDDPKLGIMLMKRVKK